MGPRPKPQAPSPVTLDPADPRWSEVVSSFAEAERGEGVLLTPEEADRFYETGELPARAQVQR